MFAANTLIVDYEDVAQDEACPMSRWWKEMEGGNGIAHKERVIPDAIEKQIRADLRMLATMEDISDTAIQDVIHEATRSLTETDKADVEKMELLYRRLAWFASFAIFVEPVIRKNFDTIAVGEDLVYGADPLFVVTHPDRVLRDKTTRQLVYREYEIIPAHVDRRQWVESWETNPRLHVGMAAATQTLNEGFDYGQMIGFGGGYFSPLEKCLMHPYLYGSFNTEEGTWNIGGYRSGQDWKRRPIWEYPGGVVTWVRRCGIDTAESVFKLSPPVDYNASLVAEWTFSKAHRERTVYAVKDGCTRNARFRLVQFPRRLTMCKPMVGKSCEFVGVCLDPKLSLEPLKSPDFVKKELKLVPPDTSQQVAVGLIPY